MTNFLRIHLLIFLIFPAIIATADDGSVARGRYLSIISGCNDCHTSGFAQNAGNIPEAEWLKGDPMGWRGPWGTTYAINLRKLIASLSAEEWINFTRNSKARPPMPTYIFRHMSDEDLRALYDFIRSLGDGGTAMPGALPPGVDPVTPYFNFVPVVPETQGSAKISVVP